MAIQHYLTMIGAIVSIPFILTPALCMEDGDPHRGTIICTMIFVTGLVTIIQATWGCRLPLVQVVIKLIRLNVWTQVIFTGRDDFVSGANISDFEVRWKILRKFYLKTMFESQIEQTILRKFEKSVNKIVKLENS